MCLSLGSLLQFCLRCLSFIIIIYNIIITNAVPVSLCQYHYDRAFYLVLMVTFFTSSYHNNLPGKIETQISTYSIINCLLVCLGYIMLLVIRVFIQPRINWWLRLVVWIPRGIPQWQSLSSGNPEVPNHQPNHQFTISCFQCYQFDCDSIFYQSTMR